MGLWNRLTGGGISTLDWDGKSPDGLLVHRFTRQGNEIRTGAKLVVHEGWAAALVCNNKVADVCPPGTYVLDAASVVALLGDNARWSPSRTTFNVDVYYVSIKPWSGLAWTLRNLPASLSGPGHRIVLQGSCGFRVENPGAFLGELLKPAVTLDEYPAANLRNVLAVRFGDWVRAKQLTTADLESDGEHLVGRARARIASDLGKMGVELTEFLVAGVGGFAGYSDANAKPRASLGDTPAPPETKSISTPENGDTASDGDDPLAEKPLAPSGPTSVRLPMAEAPPESGRMLQPQRHAPPSGRIILPDPESDSDLSSSFPLLRGWGAGPVSGRMLTSDAGPPPIKGDSQFALSITYHAALNGTPSGPFDLTTVTGKIRSGEITSATLVWRKGLSGWVPASTVPELMRFFSEAPPPLPNGNG